MKTVFVPPRAAQERLSRCCESERPRSHRGGHAHRRGVHDAANDFCGMFRRTRRLVRRALACALQPPRNGRVIFDGSFIRFIYPSPHDLACLIFLTLSFPHQLHFPVSSSSYSRLSVNHLHSFGFHSQLARSLIRLHFIHNHTSSQECLFKKHLFHTPYFIPPCFTVFQR